MDESKINKSVRNVPGYLGTFARNELESLKISHYPSFMIVNLDERAGDGSHWIAIAMFLNDVYICDSLGTLMPNADFPKELVNLSVGSGMIYPITIFKVINLLNLHTQRS